jgi:hypothetical protein
VVGEVAVGQRQVNVVIDVADGCRNVVQDGTHSVGSGARRTGLPGSADFLEGVGGQIVGGGDPDGVDAVGRHERPTISMAFAVGNGMPSSSSSLT